ncbi:hypothetical protein R3P38DRAFT_2803882 [Favolaschia claudopus]|uniref:Uncharacterized protein n=1 Tax=Favolaschia claudopus TaxID=2862362 RepID=A0AAV9ZQZ4_9AGAR
MASPKPRRFSLVPPPSLVNDADTSKDWFTHKKNEGWVIPRIANSLSIAGPDNWDTIPGAGVLDGMQKQGSDVEDSGQKEAGIDDSSAKFRRARGKRGKRYCVDNSGG